MAIKKLQQNFTTPEQSKRLLDLGVPVKSADCYYMIICGKIDDQTEIIYNFDAFHDSNDYLEDYIPCWSVGRLIEIYVITRGLYFAYFPIEKGEDMVKYLIWLYEERAKDLDFSKLEE